MSCITTYNVLLDTVKRAFVSTPPASLVPNIEKFWVLRQDELELVTDDRYNYSWCGFGDLTLLNGEHTKQGLIFRVPPVNGRKRSIIINESSWNDNHTFHCGIAAAPVQDGHRVVINGGLIAAFRVTGGEEAAIVHMVPERYYTAEITRLMFDTAAYLLLLLDALFGTK